MFTVFIDLFDIPFWLIPIADYIYPEGEYVMVFHFESNRNFFHETLNWFFVWDHVATHMNKMCYKCTYCKESFIFNMYKQRKQMHEAKWLADKVKTEEAKMNPWEIRLIHHSVVVHQTDRFSVTVDLKRFHFIKMQEILSFHSLDLFNKIDLVRFNIIYSFIHCLITHSMHNAQCTMQNT